MRFFNTEGPVRTDWHYGIPPLGRVNLNQMLSFIRTNRCFVLHAPRQTGKTSVLLALRDLLNSGAEGDFRCVYANVEVGQAAREDTGRAMRAVLSELELGAQDIGDESLAQWPDMLDRAGPEGALRGVLNSWCRADPRPLVLLIDEIDALVGDALIKVLRQLRAGYHMRPAGFPQSVVLCGVRDVRDYRIRSSAAGGMVWAAAPSTSRPGRCASATSRKTKRARCSPSTSQRLARRSRPKPWTRCGRRPRDSRGW